MLEDTAYLIYLRQMEIGSMDIALTFIIPVYNVEHYIEECVSSIINQAKSGIEIILVDDGSTDNSGKLCDALADMYSNVTTIHNENMGPSAARNTGIEIAKGLYIAFVDSDDRIAEGSVQGILEWIHHNNADICFLSAMKLFSDGTIEPLGDDIKQNEVKDIHKSNVLYTLSTKPKFSGSACTKIFRKAFLDDNKIRFPNNRRMHEDLFFSIQSIYTAKAYDALDMPYYIYRQGRAGSRSQAALEKSYKDLMLFVDETTKSLTTEDHLPINQEAGYVMAFVAYEYSLLLWKYCLLSTSIKKEAKSFLVSFRWIMKYSKNIRLILIRIVLTIMGIDLTSKALNHFMERRRIG